MKRYTHRPCFPLAIAFALGVGLNAHIPMDIAMAVLVLAFILVRWLTVSWLLVFVCLGCLHAQAAQILPPDHIAHLRYGERHEPAVVEGVIVSDVDVRQTARLTKTSFELRVEHVNGRPRTGKALVNIFRREDLCYGQRIMLTGKFHKPFPGSSLGHFSYEDYLKRNGVYWMLSVRKDADLKILAENQGSMFQAAALKSRHRFKQILEQYLNDLEAGVIQSLVLGGRYYIPDTVRQVFVETGTAHILAISGMNIGAVALLIVILLGVIRIPRPVQLVATIVLLSAYAFFTGANASVVRATAMAVIFIAGFLLEREQESLNSLGIAALLILLVDPLSLMDIGFQLSFMGVFSIIYFHPRIYGIWAGVKEKQQHGFAVSTLQALSMSLAAWVGVAPLIAYYFQVVTPITVIANLPIIPFVSALMMLGVGLILAGLCSPWLASSFAACVKIVLVAMMIIIEAFGRVPFGHWPVKEVAPWMIFVYYAVVFIVLFWLDRRAATVPASDHAHFFS
jgi:competence protein ComEC